MLDRLAPPGSRTRASLHVGAGAARELIVYASRTRWRWRHARMPRAADPEYRRWLELHRLSAEELKAQRDRIREVRIPLAVDCVLLGSGAAAAARTLRSLRAQTLPSFRALADGEPAARLAQALASGDPRNFVLVLEAGDLLEPDLLFNIVARGWDDPAVNVVHWDDDLIDESGALRDPRFRPELSPETLLCANYLGRAFAVRRERLARLDDVAAEFGGDEWFWRLLLALELDAPQVARVPRVLQHVVRRPVVDARAATSLIESHLHRAGREAIVTHERGAVRVGWPLPDPRPVSVIIPTASREQLLGDCLDGLARTDYPSLEVVVVDSGRSDAAAENFYRDRDVKVIWWDGAFNYSAANNRAAAAASGEVLVFLNDDTRLPDPGWLGELVGWATAPGIGLVGLQLTHPDGTIQHGGVVVGMDSFAGHLFAGVRPDADTLIGSTSWYRNCLSVTAACVALRRGLFEQIGGFDERFALCGSDVVLGLDARFHGFRNVCSPHGGVVHVEAKTRGTEIPPQDFFASYWRYQRWLRGGDPYYSPSLSMRSGIPRLRPQDEPEPVAAVGRVLGRELTVFRQREDAGETAFLVKACRADRALGDRVAEANLAPPFKVRTLNWFLPDIDSPFYGGINTALRIADALGRAHGVENRFVLAAAPNERYVRSALQAAFPALADARISFSDGRVARQLQTIPPADASIATQWHTAYLVANFAHTARRLYLIQDFEPLFYPAGSTYALAEETYRLGLLGVCNTPHMLELYRRRYEGAGMAFVPALDSSVFHARGRRGAAEGEPVTIFTYARPGHWRNCWELASRALTMLKQRLGDRVRLITAGSWARPDDLGRGIEHLGLLDYRDTGALYRRCDIGLALTVSEHPSYLPLELLACGAPVVAFDNPAGDWILRHEHNCLRSPRTVDGLVQALERLATDGPLRAGLAENGVGDIAAAHSDWDSALAGIYEYLCDPWGTGAAT